MKHFERRLKRYIEHHHKRGYSLEQIKKGLIVYGMEPVYAEKLVSQYQFKTTLHLAALIAVIIGLPLLAQPAVTGYYALANFNEESSGLNLLNSLILSLFVVILIPGLILAFKFAKDEKNSSAKSSQTIVADGKKNIFPDIKTIKSKLELYLANLRKRKALKEYKEEKEDAEPHEYHEKSPLMTLYNFLMFACIGIIAAGIIFRKWMLLFFSIVGIVLAFIGQTKVKKMYFREVNS